MEAAVASLRDLDYAAVKAWVLDTNRRAIAFYRKLGFAADGAEKVEHREDYRIRELRYSRNLRARSARARDGGEPVAAVTLQAAAGQTPHFP